MIVQNILHYHYIYFFSYYILTSVYYLILFLLENIFIINYYIYNERKKEAHGCPPLYSSLHMSCGSKFELVLHIHYEKNMRVEKGCSC